MRKRGLNSMTLAQAKATAVESDRLVAPGYPRRKPLKNGSIRAIIVSVALLFVLLASMAHVAQRARIATLTYDLHVENLRLAEVKRIHNHLLVQVERARSLERIEAEVAGGWAWPIRVRRPGWS